MSVVKTVGKGGTPDTITDSMRWGLYKLNWEDADIDTMGVEEALSKLTRRIEKNSGNTTHLHNKPSVVTQDKGRERVSPNGTEPKNQ
jgi:hypothetical protein